MLRALSVREKGAKGETTEASMYTNGIHGAKGTKEEISKKENSIMQKGTQLPKVVCETAERFLS